MIDEGYIKYKCDWIYSEPVSPDEIRELNHWRDKLYQLGLIGIYDNGIGFGNLSIRDRQGRTFGDCAPPLRDRQPEQFIISGTKTGSLPFLTEQHYTRVTNFDWERNFITCDGPIQASSEALTHAAVYVANPEVNAVIHVHNLEMWQRLMDKVPTTARNCAYGTPEMAREIIRLCQEDKVKETKIIVMSGHEEGIISFGRNLEEAGKVLFKYYDFLVVNGKYANNK